MHWSAARDSGVQLCLRGICTFRIDYCQGVYDITTGSLVSYPHPYRVLQLHQDDQGRNWLQIESHRVESVPNWSRSNSYHVSGWAIAVSLHAQAPTQAPLNLPPGRGVGSQFATFGLILPMVTPCLIFPFHYLLVAI